jgi:hypothetical protein
MMDGMMSEPNADAEVRKHLTTPEADELAELYLLRGDLNASRDALQLYFDKYLVNDEAKLGEEAIISGSLFRDAILLYCACFSTKDAGKLLPEAVYGHLEEWKGYYQTILDMRDAFIAHNFGPQRQHNIVVLCKQEDGQLLPFGFTEFFIRFAGWIASEKEQILRFIDIGLEHLAGRIEEAGNRVTKAIENLTPEQLAALPDAEVLLPAREDFRKSRSRFHEDGRGERRPLPERQPGRTTVTW